MKQAWEQWKHGELCEFLDRRGVTPEKLGSQFLDAGFRVVSARNIKGRRLVLDTGEQRFVNEPTYRRWMQSPLHADDVLLTSEAPLGEPAYIDDDQELCLGHHLFGIRTDKRRLFGRFLFLALQSGDVRKDLLSRASGATAQGIRQSELRHVVIPVPPLPEQQRIVALLDEAFAGLATAKANAEQNLQNARALFESHLQSVFANQWLTGELVTLREFATDITDGDHLPPPKSSTGVPFITIGNILKETREIDFTDTFMVPRAYFDALKPHKKPRQGDVLYTVTGSFGIPVIVRNDAEFCFQRHIGLVRPKPETSSSWLYYLLMSPQLHKQANDGATGTAQKTVSLTLLRSFVVPKVSSQQQKQAVEKLDALTEETQRLTRLYERKLAALEELKKSLLHQAFNGEL
jgi:type I restriction enzyme S subunit